MADEIQEVKDAYQEFHDEYLGSQNIPTVSFLLVALVIRLIVKEIRNLIIVVQEIKDIMATPGQGQEPSS